MSFYINSRFARIIDGWGIVILGNPLSRLIFALCLTAVLFLLLIGIKRLFLKNLPCGRQKEGGLFCDFIRNMLSACGWWFFLIMSVYIGSRPLHCDTYHKYLNDITKIAVFIQIGAWLSITLSELLRRWKIRNHQDAASTEVVIFNNFGRFLIWTLVLILTLDNMGVKVVSLMTGLGIGGIAVALAVQKILGDLFASVSIMIDKPFEIGDMVVVGDFSGFVEKIGMKTTRMRSISGEQLILSNSDLLESRIRNYKRMVERRVTFSFGVPYNTRLVDLESIPGIFKDIIDEREGVRFDRAHLQRVGDFSMIYECIYWIESPDVKVFMDIQQSVILSVISVFNARGISFAYPTRALYSCSSYPYVCTANSDINREK